MSYQPPPPYTVVQVVRPPSNGVAITSMILGIIAIVIGVWSLVPILGLVAAFFAFVPALVAVVAGHVGMSRSRQMGGTGQGQASTGLVLGYLTLGIIVATTLFWIVIGVVSNSTSG